MLEMAQQASFCRLSWVMARRCWRAGSTEQLIITCVVVRVCDCTYVIVYVCMCVIDCVCTYVCKVAYKGGGGGGCALGFTLLSSHSPPLPSPTKGKTHAAAVGLTPLTMHLHMQVYLGLYVVPREHIANRPQGRGHHLLVGMHQ